MLVLKVLHVLSTPEDSSGDGSVLLACLLVLASAHVRSGGLNILEDLDTVVDDLLLSVDDQLFGVEEGLAHLLEPLSIF